MSCFFIHHHFFFIFFYFRRQPHHWSNNITPSNPRGYSDMQQQRIAAAASASDHALIREIELKVLYDRRRTERRAKTAYHDAFGLRCIARMISEVRDEFEQRTRAAQEAESAVGAGDGGDGGAVAGAGDASAAAPSGARGDSPVRQRHIIRP